MVTAFALILACVSIGIRAMLWQERQQRRQGAKQLHASIPSEPPPPKAKQHTSLATVVDGELVRLVGKVRGTTIESKLTGRACVAYLSRAQVWHSRKIPQLIEDLRESKGTFVLEVGDGEVVVDGAFVIEKRTGRITPKSPEAAHALLAAHKLERFSESSDFEEALIEDGDEVAVTGIVQLEAIEAAGYRELPRERRRFVAHPRLPITITPA